MGIIFFVFGIVAINLLLIFLTVIGFGLYKFSVNIDRNFQCAEQISFLSQAVIDRMEKNDTELQRDLEEFMEQYEFVYEDRILFWQLAEKYFSEYFRENLTKYDYSKKLIKKARAVQ